MWIERLTGDRMSARRIEHEFAIEYFSQRTGISLLVLKTYERVRPVSNAAIC